MSRPISGRHTNNFDPPTSNYNITAHVDVYQPQNNEDISCFGSCKFEPKRACENMWDRMHTW